MTLNRDDLIRIIKKEISYTGDGGTKCRHCGKYVVEPRYWLDHEAILARAIVEHCCPTLPQRLRGNVKEEVEERLDDIILTGKEAVDAVSIADDILAWFTET